MRHAPRSFIAGLTLTASLASGLPFGAPGVFASSRDTGPFRVLAGPYPKKAAAAGDGAAISHFTIKGLTISVEFLEPGARAAFVSRVASASSDPFAVPPGRPELYRAVRVSFDNQSNADVVFQPGNVVLLTDKKTQEFALDLTDLYRFAARGGADPQGLIERVAALIFDSSTTIPKGRTMERLIVFGPLAAKWKELRLHFSFLQIGSETHSASFTFHRHPLGG